MRFTIQDSKTGKSVTVEGSQAPTLADREKIFQQAGLRSQQTQKPQQPGLVQKGSDMLRSLGLGAIPTIGAGAFEGGRALVGAAQGENAYKQGGVYGMDANGQQMQNPFMTQQQLGKYSTVQGGATEALKNTAGLTSYGIPFGKIGLLGKMGVIKPTSGLATKFAGAVGEFAGKGAVRGGLVGASQENADAGSIAQGAAIGGVAEPLFAGIGSYRKLLSSKGTNKLIEGGAQKATEAGKSVEQEKLFSSIKNDVYDKFGNTAEVRKITDKIVGGLTKPNLSAPKLAQAGEGAIQYSPKTATFNPNELLTGRRQIAARQGTQNMFTRLFQGSNLEHNVSGVARGTISKELKNLAPDLNTADAAYSLYSKLHGSPSTHLTRAIGLYILGNTIGKPLLSLLEGAL